VTPSSWPGTISRSSGVKLQLDCCGSPEQETVMNAGALPKLSIKDGKGVMVTVPVPVCPAVRVFDGDRLETVTANDALHWELMVGEAAAEGEPCA
jgi:hypothetical protein